MGGHGGLNILPQKKWNVYNYDNRAIVEKDIKQYKQKQRIKFQKDRINQLRNKIQVLIDDDKCQDELKKPNSLLIQELNKIKEQNQHINLFVQEERIIQNRQIEEIKRIKEISAIRDKSLDYSSKFLGTYTQEKEIPWYVKNKNKHYDTNKKYQFKYYEEIEKNQINLKYQENHNTIRNNRNINHNKFQQKSRSRQKNKNNNNNNNKQKQILKIENQQKNINVMEKLKLQRLKRQAKQHKKTEELKKYSYYKK